MIRELTIQGVLSFGPGTPPFPMRSLNVLIGPNGSGKSNLLEVIGLLRASATNLSTPVRKGGGIAEWLYKGNAGVDGSVEATLATTYPSVLMHRLVFGEVASRFTLRVEEIHRVDSSTNLAGDPVYLYEAGRGGMLFLEDGDEVDVYSSELSSELSILSQRRDPRSYPELTHLANGYGKIRLYRSWSFGGSSPLRQPQRADLPVDKLEEDLSNLGLFLNHLRGVPEVKRKLLNQLQELYEEIEDFDVRIQGGTVEVFLTESGQVIPASRLSDGTLRYLCLLAVLLDPEPPRVVCIEEPELGLHPDLLPGLADLLVEASERMQLVVTTHSDILVNELTSHPESVVIVEKHDGATRLNRLAKDSALEQFLQKYRLGQLWLTGEFGGTRW